MAEIAFYHLQTTSLEAALPQLLAKCMQRDWPVVVECGNPDRVNALDEHLWTFNDTAFLPHGTEPENADRQPIWLCADEGNPNAAKVRFYVEGAMPHASSDYAPYERVILMFDGNNDQIVSTARSTWKALRTADHSLSYWKQSEAGGWQKAGG
jgi:DNA polymerase-3 subunit chi